MAKSTKQYGLMLHSSVTGAQPFKSFKEEKTPAKKRKKFVSALMNKKEKY